MPCQEAFPLQFRNFMQEALHLLELADGLANRVLQSLRNATLANFAGMALHKIQRRVPLAAGAMAVGLAALAGTLRQRPPQKPFAGGDLRDTGTEVALGSGKFGAAETRRQCLVSILYKT